MTLLLTFPNVTLEILENNVFSFDKITYISTITSKD